MFVIQTPKKNQSSFSDQIKTFNCDTCSSKYDIRCLNRMLSETNPSLAFWDSSALSRTTPNSFLRAATSSKAIGDMLSVTPEFKVLRNKTIWAGSGAAAKSLVKSSRDLLRTIFPLTSMSLKEAKLI